MWPTWWSVADLGGRRENEHNNTLKTKGYNLEHNFGHGSEHLSKLPFCSTRCSSSLTNATLCCENLYAADRPSSKTSDHSPVTGALMAGMTYCCSCYGASNCPIPGDSPFSADALSSTLCFVYSDSNQNTYYERRPGTRPISAILISSKRKTNGSAAARISEADAPSLILPIPCPPRMIPEAFNTQAFWLFLAFKSQIWNCCSRLGWQCRNRQTPLDKS